MYYAPEWLLPHVISVLASIALLIAAWRAPRLGRSLFVLLFAWACWTNWTTVLRTPWVYLDYAPLAVSGLYRSFIHGGFAHHVVPFVGTIATCQGLIAIGLLLGGPFAFAALVGATVFLVAIAPLGVGSGFPSTLLMAIGATLLATLCRDAIEKPLWIELRHALEHRSPRHA